MLLKDGKKYKQIKRDKIDAPPYVEVVPCREVIEKRPLYVKVTQVEDPARG